MAALRKDYAPWLAVVLVTAVFAVALGFLPVPIAVALTAVVTTSIWAASIRLRTSESDDAPAHADLTALLEKHVAKGRRILILDPLTLLLKSWYFELRIDEEIVRCRRYGSPMTMLTISWPDSREVQRGGLSEADLVRELVNRLRTVDLAARREEGHYAICLPHTGMREAQGALRRLLRDYESIEVNVGLAEYTDGTWQTSHLIEAADAASRPLASWKDNVNLNQRRLAYNELLGRVQTEDAGSVDLAEGETFKGMKGRLVRASHRAGVELQIWAEDGKVYFKRLPVPQLQTAVA